MKVMYIAALLTALFGLIVIFIWIVLASIESIDQQSELYILLKQFFIDNLIITE